MMFNTDIGLLENVKYGLWATHRTIDQMAADLGTTPGSVKTIINERFSRNGKTPPLHRKVFNYLQLHCVGFGEYAKQRNIAVDSIELA